MMQSKASDQPRPSWLGRLGEPPHFRASALAFGVGGQDPARTEGPARRQVWYTCHVPGTPTGAGLILRTARGGGDSVSVLRVRKPRCGGLSSCRAWIWAHARRRPLSRGRNSTLGGAHARQ